MIVVEEYLADSDHVVLGIRVVAEPVTRFLAEGPELIS